MTRRRRLSQGAGVAAAIAVALLGVSCEGGPSEPEVVALTVAPDLVVLTYVGERALFTVEVTGQAGATGGSAVTWTSTDTTVFTVDGRGEVSAVANGEAELLASSPGMLNGRARVVVAQEAAEMEVLGAGQRAGAGFALVDSVGVRVLDAGRTVVPPTLVRFEAGGGGLALPGAVYSDSTGVARTVWRLGPEPGRQTLAATLANGVRTEIAATALGPEEAVALVAVQAGGAQFAAAGEPLPEPVVVRVVDAWGRNVPGAPVRFEPAPGSGRVDPVEAVSDGGGLAATAWTLGEARGEQTLVVAAGGARREIGATALSDEGVCGRTPEVAEEIVRQANINGAGVSDCAGVTEAHLGEIRNLRLGGLGIRSLKSGDFHGLTGLFGMSLSSNELTELPPDIFSGTPALRSLHMSYNKLTALPPGVFAGLPKLHTLNVRGNPLREVPPDVFAGLRELLTLYLSVPGLTELPPGLFADLGELTGLVLDFNRLASLPSGIFAGLSSIRGLTVNYSGLATLPPDVFRGLSRLERLALDNNQLSELPPGIFAGLERLERLRLNNNQLRSLPTEIFAGLERLETLDLSGNRDHLNLNTLVLPVGIFAGLSSLRDLSLGQNGMRELPAGIFAGLSNLEVLTLDRNGLLELRPGVFAGLSNLRRLSLWNNKLKELPPGVFAGLTSLEEVLAMDNPGAPFSVAVELARVDARDPLAPGPARVAMRVQDGAPFGVRMPVSAQLGTASARWVQVGPGDTVSAPLDVGRTTGSGAVHVTFGPPPPRPGGYSGFEVVAGEELVLFSESDNRTPVSAEMVPPYWMPAGSAPAEVELSPYFSDPDDDSLAHEVASGNEEVVTGRVEGGVLWIEPRARGESELQVTATDPGGLRATQRLRVTVASAPDPDRFDIELIIGPGFSDEQRAAMRRAADRWEEVVVGDLPDVPFDGHFGARVLPDPGPRMVGSIDDLVIRVFGESPMTGAWGGPHDESRLSLFGMIAVGPTYRGTSHMELFEALMLHEMGHVLGIGGRWGGFVPNTRSSDHHFPGPLAVNAFNEAGGLAYEDDKVPIEMHGDWPGVHWRSSVITGDIMGFGWGRGIVSAITVGALGDMGYEVDLSKADPYTLPGTSQGDLAGGAVGDDAGGPGFEFPEEVILQGPVMVVDEHGAVVRVIRP